MRRMLATATAVASATSCSRGQGETVVVTIPPPTATSSNNAPVPRPTGTAIASTPPAPDPPPAPSDTAGYLVVDMLPAPARCLGLASSSHVTGRFRHDVSGVVLDVTVTLASGQATFTKTAPNAWSGQVVSSGYPSATVATARMRPPTGAAGSSASIGVSFGVSCGSKGTGVLAVTANFTLPAQDGDKPSLTLHDY